MNATAETPQAKQASAKRPGRIRLGAVVAIAAAIAVAAFFLLRDGDDPAPQVVPPAPVATNAPEVVSLATLRNRAARTDEPLYWAGALQGRKYEVTETPDRSRIFVRYLPLNAQPGAKKPYLTIATYRMPNAFSSTRAVARRDGSRTIPVANGGVAFFATDHPTSVYLAYPEIEYQVEVFHPRADISHQLVRSGQVRPIDES